MSGEKRYLSVEVLKQIDTECDAIEGYEWEDYRTPDGGVADVGTPIDVMTFRDADGVLWGVNQRTHDDRAHEFGGDYYTVDHYTDGVPMVDIFQVDES